MDQRVEEQLLKDMRAADKTDKDRKELFEGMVKSKAWQVYVELLNNKLQGMSDDLLRPAGSVDGMVAQEYVKGAMSGLVLARDIPIVTIAAMAQISGQASEDTGS